MPAMEVVVRTARPDDPADGLLYESAAPYYAAYAGGPSARGGCCARSTRAAGTPRAGRSATSRRPAARSSACSPRSRRATATRSRAASSGSRCMHSAPWRDPAADPPPARDRGGLAASAGADALRRRARHRCRAPAARRRARAARPGRRHGRRRRAWTGVALDTGIENRAGALALRAQRLRPSALRPAPDERTARARRRLRASSATSSAR